MRDGGGSQVYTNLNCQQQDYEIRQGTRRPTTASPPAGQSLREKLRDALKKDAAQSAQANKIADRISDAKDRAEEALRRGIHATNADSRARAKRDYTTAMKDLSKAYGDADLPISEEQRADWQRMKQQSIADLQTKAAQAFAPLAPTQTASAAPRRALDLNIVEFCEPQIAGQRLRDCYQLPRRGLSCVKVFKNDRGDEVWKDIQETCVRADLLEKRNEHFNRLDAARPSTPQIKAVTDLPPECRSQLSALLDGAQKKDGGKAHAAYAALRAQCEDGIRKLAQAANAHLPERRLNSRASAALAEAMNRQPGQTTFSSGTSSGGSRHAANNVPAYDVDEVIDLGIGILGLLNGAAGLQANRAVRDGQTPAVRQPTSTYGQGAAPPYQAPRIARAISPARGRRRASVRIRHGALPLTAFK